MSRAWLALVVVLGVGVSHRALADDTADCDWFEISATSGKTASIDPELKAFEKKLTHKPLSSWNVFHKLSSGHAHLEKLKAQSLKLAQGSASVLLRDRSDRRLELGIAIDGADGKRVLDTKQSAAAGEWSVFVHNVKDDGHILALTCK